MQHQLKCAASILALRANEVELCTMAGGLQGLIALGACRCLRTDARPTAPAVALAHGAQCRTYRCSDRCPIDTLGLLLAITVTAASVQNRDVAEDVVGQACRKSLTLKRLYTDGAYDGKCAPSIEHAHNIRVEVVHRLGNRSTGTLHDSQQLLWPLLRPGSSAAKAQGGRAHSRLERTLQTHGRAPRP